MHGGARRGKLAEAQDERRADCLRSCAVLTADSTVPDKRPRTRGSQAFDERQVGSERNSNKDSKDARRQVADNSGSRSRRSDVVTPGRRACSNNMIIRLLLSLCLLTLQSVIGVPTTTTAPAAAASSSSPFTAPLVCLNGGVLLRTRDPHDPTLVDVQCACANGWGGETCDYRDFCATSNPCVNGGQCFNTYSGALCHCPDAWAGGTCAQPSPCVGEPCSGHGTCLLREVKQTPSTVENNAEKRATAAHRRRRHTESAASEENAPESDPASSSSSSSESSPASPSELPHSLTTVVTGHCRCEAGWTGSHCSLKHTDVCAAVEPCTIFNSARGRGHEGEGPLCGCEAALAQRCTWCLEQGVAYAPDDPALLAPLVATTTASGDSAPPTATASATTTAADTAAAASTVVTCLAAVDLIDQCPPAAAQTIRSCSMMDGTPFGFCLVGSGPYGYCVDGNPSAPSVGSRKCHHWTWDEAGCRPEWGTRDPHSNNNNLQQLQQQGQADAVHSLALIPPPHPTEEQCLHVPPCSDAETAGSSVCGCQAALTIGCSWCLEQQLAFPSGASSSGCRGVATTSSQCPSQQAQTVHQCVGVGGTAYGWCSIDAEEQSMGESCTQ